MSGVANPPGNATPHQVVVNAEEQYTIWPAARPLPAGWTATGIRGDRERCLARIADLWTDPRPASLRAATARGAWRVQPERERSADPMPGYARTAPVDAGPPLAHATGAVASTAVAAVDAAGAPAPGGAVPARAGAAPTPRATTRAMAATSGALPAGDRRERAGRSADARSDRAPAVVAADPAPHRAAPPGVESAAWWREPKAPAEVAADRATVRGARVPLPNVGVHVLIDECAARDPHGVALRGGGRRLTRAELVCRSLAWARALLASGVRQERPVAILLPRSVDAVLAVVAVLRAGAPYLPLAVTDRRVRDLLRDAGDPLVVTDEAGRERLRGYRGPVLTVDRLEQATVVLGDPSSAAPADCRYSPEPPTVTGAHLAYLVYGPDLAFGPRWCLTPEDDHGAVPGTAPEADPGAGGDHRGVSGTHGQVVNLVRWCAEEFAVPPRARALLHAPLSSPSSFATLFTALVAGWELEVAPEPLTLHELAALARRDGPCGFLALTPEQARALVELGEADGLARRVAIGDEPLYLTGGLAGWVADSPRTRFAHHHDLAEAAGALWYGLTGREPAGRRSPAGRPIHNTEVHVLDPDGQPLPFDEVGEVCLAGAALARGYHGDPSRTAARWTPHPWGRPGERLLRTGDLARLSPDGTVEIVGRGAGERTVPVQGHPVALPAVEEALRRQPGVVEAVASLVPDARSVPRLTGYLRSAPGARLDTRELRAQLRTELPEPSVPTRLVLVPYFPLTPHGTVDHPRLASVPALRPATAGPFEEPASRTEAALCALFAQVLRMETVGAHDDFFALGGDSLSAVQVVSAVEEDLGADLTVRELFDTRTPRGLAALVPAEEDLL